MGPANAFETWPATRSKACSEAEQLEELPSLGQASKMLEIASLNSILRALRKVGADLRRASESSESLDSFGAQICEQCLHSVMSNASTGEIFPPNE